MAKNKNKILPLLLGAGLLFFSSFTSRKYKASDGKAFATQQERDAHEQSLIKAKEEADTKTEKNDPLITDPTTSNPNATTNYRDTATKRGQGNSNANPSDEYGAGVNREDREYNANTRGENKGYDRSANSYANNDGNDLSAEDFYEQRVFVSDATIQWFHANDASEYENPIMKVSDDLHAFNATFIIWAKLINMSDVKVQMKFINVKASILGLETIGVLKFLKYDYTLSPKSESQWLPIAYYDQIEKFNPLFDYKYLLRDLNLYYNKVNIKESLYFLPASVFFRYDVYLPFDGFKVADCHSEFDTECLSIPIRYNFVNAPDTLGICKDGKLMAGESGDILLNRKLVYYSSGKNMLNPEVNADYKRYLDFLRSPSMWNWNSITYPIRYVIKKYREQGKTKTATVDWDRLEYGGEDYPQLGHLVRIKKSTFPILGIVYDKDGNFAYE